MTNKRWSMVEKSRTISPEPALHVAPLIDHHSLVINPLTWQRLMTNKRWLMFEKSRTISPEPALHVAPLIDHHSLVNGTDAIP